MKKHKVLLLILATTFSPFIIAAVLTSNYFSQQLGQKQYGTFLNESIYVTDIGNETQDLQNKQWLLVISPNNINYDKVFNKLKNIKTALGKRSDRVNIMINSTIRHSTKDQTQVQKHEDLVYIASPQGQVLLAYSDELIGKPLFKDLSHLLRSNNI